MQVESTFWAIEVIGKSFGKVLNVCRSAEQVSERLDMLISKIRDLQSPYMHGEKPANVVLV